MLRNLWRPARMLGLVAVIAVLAVACGSDKDNSDKTPSGAGSPSAAAPTVASVRPGAAGIASNPRDVKGLEGLLTLDDGLAMFKERPASDDRTGVTKDTIKLGRYSSVTGPLATYEAFWDPFLQAVIKRINDAGGIHGRKLELTTMDDQYNPSQTVQVTQKLIENDKVFSLFFAVGNPSHQAVAEYVQQKGVPSLWHTDGNAKWNEPSPTRTEFPGLVPDLIEGVIMGDYVGKQKSGVKVAVIYENDALGQPGLQGIKYAIQKNGGTVVAEIGYDITQPDMTAQAQQAADAKPDWILFYGVDTNAIATIRALHENIGSQIPIMERGALPAPGISQYLDGVTFGRLFPDPYLAPDNPVWPALEKLTKEDNVQYNPVLTQLAFSAIEHLVRALELAGPDLTRQGVVAALEDGGFDGSWTCKSCLGPTILSPIDHWTYEYSQVVKWNEAQQGYEKLTPIVSYETSEGKGIRGNLPGYDCKPETCPWKKE